MENSFADLNRSIDGTPFRICLLDILILQVVSIVNIQADLQALGDHENIGPFVVSTHFVFHIDAEAGRAVLIIDEVSDSVVLVGATTRLVELQSGGVNRDSVALGRAVVLVHSVVRTARLLQRHIQHADCLAVPHVEHVRWVVVLHSADRLQENSGVGVSRAVGRELASSVGHTPAVAVAVAMAWAGRGAQSLVLVAHVVATANHDE